VSNGPWRGSGFGNHLLLVFEVGALAFRVATSASGPAIYVVLAFDAEADGQVADRVIRAAIGVGAARDRAFSKDGAAHLRFFLAVTIAGALHTASGVAQAPIAGAIGIGEALDAASRTEVAPRCAIGALQIVGAASTQPRVGIAQGASGRAGRPAVTTLHAGSGGQAAGLRVGAMGALQALETAARRALAVTELCCAIGVGGAV
jgi:hypothetical protein